MKSNTLYSVATMSLAGLAAMTGLRSQNDQFPGDWFYDQCPKDLRALEGKEAPAIQISEWRGDAVSIADQRGRVVVIDFWATWCGPCMRAIPKNIELVEKHGDAVTFIGVHDANSGWGRVDSVLSSKGINYPVGKDDGGKSTKAYHLGFWPTYVVVDKSGVVRGAGLKPGKVKDAVEQLLAESGPVPSAGPKKAGFPDDFYLGGAKRPASLRAAEGKKAPERVLATSDDPKGRSSLGEIMVYQFVQPELAFTMAPLKQLADVAQKYGDQGVTVVGIFGKQSDAAAVQQFVKKHKLTIPVAIDLVSVVDSGKPTTKPTTRTTKPSQKPALGDLASAFGVQFAPATVVVDRAGVVRAAGASLDRLPDILNTLLAEPLPELPEAEEADDEKTGKELKNDEVGRGSTPR